MNNLIKDLKSFYKKNKVKTIFILIVIVFGLIFAPYITVSLIIIIYLWKRFKDEDKRKEGQKKQCPHCKKEIEMLASRCPNCHGKMNIMNAKTKILVVIIIIITVFIVVSVSKTTNQTNTTPSKSSTVETDRDIISTVFAEDVIKKFLKAPSTTKFVDVKAYELSNEKDVWVVNGYLDSQNGFGAMIRSTWEVQLDYRDGKGGTIKSILLDGEKLQ